jgi:hypothetical protein
MTHHERTRFERMAIAEADTMAVERTVQIFLDRDLTDSLREFGKKWCDIPVLMLHGSEDLANPVDRSPAYVMNLLPNSDSELKVYEGSAHGRFFFSSRLPLLRSRTVFNKGDLVIGLYQTDRERCISDIRQFLDKVDS